MPNFDLSNAADFSRVTSNALTNINSLINNEDGHWDIKEASYNGVKFHVFSLSTRNRTDSSGQLLDDVEKTIWDGALEQISDSAGRRKVKYTFPYVDGQTTDDLGRMAETFEINAIISGTHYLTGYARLKEEFNKSAPGVLMHPVKGEITCVPESVQETHRHDHRKAVILRIVFTEHNFSVGSLSVKNDTSVKSAITQALEVFAIVDRAIAKVEALQLFGRGVKNLIEGYLNIFKSNSAATLTGMNTTFNNGTSTDIPALLPLNLGGTSTSRTSSSVTDDENFVVVRSVSDPFNSVPVQEIENSVTAQALAVADLERQTQALRDEVASIIRSINDAGGALELYDTILELRQTVLLMQAVLERGVASSSARIVNYTTPRDMSIREVAFINAISPDRVREIDLLNPELPSANLILKGTTLQVPNS